MRRFHLLSAGAWTLFLLLALSDISFSAGPETIEQASAEQIVDGMANKFGRGITNTGTGWLEFPKQIYQTWQEEGPTKGLLIGPLKGIGMTVTRTVGGVLEVATFFVAWPGFFDPYLEPHYVWQQE